MVFSSIIFLYFFLPIVFLTYYLVPKNYKNIILIVSGIIFYGWGEPIYIGMLIISILIDYLSGLGISKFKDQKYLRVLFLMISVVMNIGLLGFFKYSGFFIDNINNIFGVSIESVSHPLPIGISFYTFQSMSYTIDLFMKKIKVQKSFLNFATYVTLFPQLVAGPIVRYKDISDEIVERDIKTNDVYYGIYQFVKGLSKKVLIANNIGYLWTTVKGMDLESLPVITAWVGILAFTFQIYFDFSGYSDMACGLGRMLGFKFPKNFNYPYIAKSISDFWRRWHITLGDWFKSYVYFPLGGNRRGLARTILNLIIVWFLTGFWHGANWNFIIWGVYFGIIIIIEKLFLGKVLEKIPSFFQILYTFFLVVIGWVIFEFIDLNNLFIYIKSMFGLNNGGFIDSGSVYLLVSYLFVFIVCIIFSTPYLKNYIYKLCKTELEIIDHFRVIFIVLGLILSTAYLIDASYNPFLYFRF
ncbi:MAG: MBOAT family protein [Oscillospiraceae bacterium]|nr:MBOAT family protein [Oscillospiraceae bacterium]